MSSAHSLRIQVKYGVVFAVVLFSMFGFASTARAQSDVVPPPTITSLARTEGGTDVLVSGRSLPGSMVVVSVTTNDGVTVFTDELNVDAAGEWRLTIDDSEFPVGAYTLHAATRAQDGMLSEPTEARGFKLKQRPLLSVSNVDIGWLHVFVTFILSILTAAGILGWMYERARRRRDVYATIAERDINNMCGILADDTQRLGTLFKEATTIEPHIAAEVEYLIKTEQATLEKMKGYLAAGVRKIR